MKNQIIIILFLLSIGANAQRVGGSCEGCEAVFEYGSKKLTSVDTLPDFKEPGPKLEISGTIYLADGKTAARNVILYIYHTDQKGVYPQKGNETGWAKRHGYLRGWIKTNADGKYRFYTLRPASYPNSRAPQHIHPVIKEPNRNEYYIDEYLFTNDPFLDEKEKANQQKRGGSGIITLRKKQDGTWVGKRDIFLGLNIPNY
jgi:protocatechuate 3,4-dioxygenase, beta subunit